MPKWTKEQVDAIIKSGQNIIVSAGAGSGKTAVLTERVIEKLKQGIKINELLILTFTNAAAKEMEDRIRRKIEENSDLLDNLDYLPNSYITTFDSYMLSLVKKYNYILNVSPNLSIIDSGLISMVKKNIIENIFNNYYESKDKEFLEFISDLTTKNDTSIKSAILNIINSMELILDKKDFLDNYLDNFLSEEKINNYINEYLDIIKGLIKEIETILYYINESDYYEYINAINNSLDKLIKSNTYEEILRNSYVSLPRRPRNSDDIKEYKDRIDELLKEIKSYLRYENIEEIYESFNISKKYIKVIIRIIKDYYKKLEEYKFTNDLYEFTDIEIMGINLLKNNSYIREEVKMSFKEICVDEYQDTNDLQEEFIKLVSNDNVYMVGDIKQSIYGFRNANPTIFKEKYDNYKDGNGGLKIDLLKNFRSRKEVLSCINLIFSLVMDKTLGGADYKLEHQMIFGNNTYEENKAKQNYDLEILNYNLEDNFYSREEVEAFIVAKDIKEKWVNNYQVIDKFTNKLRNVTYNDFCLILDRGTNFPKIKQIFEYLNIPLTIIEDKTLTNETDIMLIKNIISLLLKIKNKEYDSEFNYYYLSIARSFLFNISDEETFINIKNKDINKTIIYKKCLNILEDIKRLDSNELIIRILNEFNYYDNLVKTINIEDSIIRVDNLLNIAKNLNTLGYTIVDFKEYLESMLNDNIKITYKVNNNSSNSVKIMNIHKSKGLEFPICYFLGLHKKFNTSDIKERFIFNKEYGIITPFYKEGIGTTILKDLLKHKYNIDNISEQIRLFYVALTRSREKIIIVTSLDEIDKYNSNLVDISERCKYNSFLSILNSIKFNLKEYIYNVNLNDLNLTKSYLYQNNKLDSLNKRCDNTISYKELNIDNTYVENYHASKEIHTIISKSEKELLEKGTLYHEIFERTDFLNINKDNPLYKQINNFVNKFNINENTLIYKEHEFIYEEDNISYHGIIDLVLINDNVINIIDYKLKNIDDVKYQEQLKVYYNYLKSIMNKEIHTYLYSILSDELREIEI